MWEIIPNIKLNQNVQHIFVMWEIIPNIKLNQHWHTHLCDVGDNTQYKTKSALAHTSL